MTPGDARARPASVPTAVFIGASAGGIETLVELLSQLPPDLPAPVLVVLHISPRGKDMLASILDRAGPLRAVTATDGQRLEPGVVYIAPRDRHMLALPGSVALSDGPAEHGVRPAIDPLFRSAARAYRAGAVGVVLSGMLHDGTSGLVEIRRQGGHALVQDPTEALYPQMPTSAIAHVDVDWVLPVAGLAAKIEELLRDPQARAPSAGTSAPHPRPDGDDGQPTPGMRTDLTCPVCRAPLWETARRGQVTYRCHAGHEFSVAGLLTAQEEDLDDALWRPVRLLHQQAALQQRLSAQAHAQGRERSARYFEAQAEASIALADKMRSMLATDQERTAQPGGQEGEAR